MLSRGGSRLKPLDDGSILSTGPAPVKDTYDIMLLPGKKRITALRLEVLPDETMPERGLGRAADGRFVLTAIEIRNTTFSESSEPPLVYVSRAEADINQKPKEEPSINDMFPGPIDTAIVIEPLGGSGAAEGRMFGGWSIVDDERKKPDEAIFLPLEPLDTNEASVIRISLHHVSSSSSRPYRPLSHQLHAGRSNPRADVVGAGQALELNRALRDDVTKAYATAFELEKDIKNEPLDLKKSYTKVVSRPRNEAVPRSLPGRQLTEAGRGEGSSQEGRPGARESAVPQAGPKAMRLPQGRRAKAKLRPGVPTRPPRSRLVRPAATLRNPSKLPTRR